MKVYKKTNYVFSCEEAGDVQVTHWEKADKSRDLDLRLGFQVHHTLSVKILDDDGKTVLEEKSVSWGQMIPAQNLAEVEKNLLDFIKEKNAEAKQKCLDDYMNRQAQKDIKGAIAIAPRGMSLQQLVAANKSRGRKNGHR